LKVDSKNAELVAEAAEDLADLLVIEILAISTLPPLKIADPLDVVVDVAAVDVVVSLLVTDLLVVTLMETDLLVASLMERDLLAVSLMEKDLLVATLKEEKDLLVVTLKVVTDLLVVTLRVKNSESAETIASHPNLVASLVGLLEMAEDSADRARKEDFPCKDVVEAEGEEAEAVEGEVEEGSLADSAFLERTSFQSRAMVRKEEKKEEGMQTS